MNTIEETIKMAGLGKKKAMKKQIDLFESKLNGQGEKLIAVCASMKGAQQLYVTDQRIVLHEIKGLLSNNEVSIPLSSINSINIISKFVHSTIEIISSGNAAVINNVPIHLATEIKNIVEGLKVDSKKSTNANPNPQNDVADELIKLKGLVDSGILTQEEFDAKKKQLLGI